MKIYSNFSYNFVITNLVHPRSKQFTPHSDLQLSSQGISYAQTLNTPI